MMQLDAIENGCNFFEVIFSDLNKKTEIPLEFDLQNIEKGDYLKAALKVLRRKKIVPKRGYKLIISSNIPINSGLSSSTALIIVWINFLFKAFGKKSISPKEIAQIAYEVEVIEQKSSGGKMDHFTISLGNTIYLDTKTDKVTSYKKLDLELNKIKMYWSLLLMLQGLVQPLEKYLTQWKRFGIDIKQKSHL